VRRHPGDASARVSDGAGYRSGVEITAAVFIVLCFLTAVAVAVGTVIEVRSARRAKDGRSKRT
jgi:hypothetical protein